MLSKTKFLFYLLICLTLACTPRNKTNHSIEEESGLVTSKEFVQFYEKFHSDSLFQINHIVFPLEGHNYNEDNEKEKIYWNAKNWKLHKNFDDMGGTFVRSFSEFGGIISEKIVDDKNISSMERRFSQIQNEWHLIYYDPIHLTGS